MFFYYTIFGYVDKLFEKFNFVLMAKILNQIQLFTWFKSFVLRMPTISWERFYSNRPCPEPFKTDLVDKLQVCKSQIERA